MIIVSKQGPKKAEIKAIVDYIKSKGLTAFVSEGTEKTVIGAIGDERVLDKGHLEIMPGVERVIPILASYKFASREFKPKNTVINVKGVEIGGNAFTMIAGPCAVESEEQMMASAKALHEVGVRVLRGSAFKPRTSPYEFQGLEEEGLQILRKAADKYGMVVETEVMDPRDVGLIEEYVDILRVGARNMQNYDLLKELGTIKKPVIIKNGLASTIKEFLMAAEYVLAGGNQKVILCERGIRTAETETRFTLDISAIPVLKKLSHLPVIVDPSHSSGKSYLVPPMCKAALAAGADGIIIEVHPDPAKALCDGPQQLTPPQFAQLWSEMKPIAHAVGRTIQ
ncbi:MAG: 3-deoxy-7-phosphoheptulonate synthase [Candidatus Micrarchaeia archaeon]|jgi:3-deoxy-7-phosphoheptulonate synthase